MNQLTKFTELETYTKELFERIYKSRFTNDSEELYTEFEQLIEDKAKNLGMDVELLSVTGEMIFNTQKEFESEEKYYFIQYINDGYSFIINWV